MPLLSSLDYVQITIKGVFSKFFQCNITLEFADRYKEESSDFINNVHKIFVKQQKVENKARQP